MLSWATIMAVQTPDCFKGEENTTCKGSSQSCWDGYNESPYTYITSIPMTVALAVSR